MRVFSSDSFYQMGIFQMGMAVSELTPTLDLAFGGLGSNILHGGAVDRAIGRWGSEDLALDTLDFLDGQFSKSLVLNAPISDIFYANVNGDSGNNTLDGTTGDDVINGFAGDDTITTFAGNDIVDAGDGDDTVIIDENGQGTLDGGTGDDTITMNTNTYFNAFYTETTGAITIYTNAGAYTAVNFETFELINSSNATVFVLKVGGAGNDVLLGGTADAQLHGGAGDDTLDASLSTGAQLFGGAGADTMIGGTGAYDQVVYESSDAGVTVYLDGTAGVGGHAQGDVISNVESISGSQFADSLFGAAQNDLLFGLDGNDIIDGGAGNDQIRGGYGNDTLTGGTGNDVFNHYVYENAFSDTITDFSTDDKVTLYQGLIDGNYVLPSFIGTAVFSGVVGEMRYEKTGGQTLVYLDTNGDGTANETLTLSNGEHDLLAINPTGNSFELVIDPTVTGTPGNDVINGTPGDDVINSLAGNDIITTFTGNDTIDLGAGDDTVIIDENGQGTLDGGTGYDTITLNSDNYFGAYVDEVSHVLTINTAVGSYAAVNFELFEVINTSGVTIITFESGTAGVDTLDATSYTGAVVFFGLEGNDILTGGSAQSTLYGGDGDDTLTAGTGYAQLYGGDGADTLQGGAGGSFLVGGAGADIIAGGIGFDQAGYSQSTAGVTVYLDGVTPGVGGDAQGDVLSGIESVFGSQFADSLFGNALSNQLLGLGGDDIIDGGDGNDQLYGGGGSDTLTGGAGFDEFVFQTYENAFSDEITDFASGDKLTMTQGFINGSYVLPSFIGTAAFSSVAGEMRYEKTGGQTLIHIDLDGDGTADETLTLSNGEHDVFEISNSGSQFELAILPPAGTPNLVTTNADEIAENTNLAFQGADGTGLSLREAIAIANATAGADTISYDTNVLATEIIDVTPFGTIDITDDLTLSLGPDVFATAANPIFRLTQSGVTVTNDGGIYHDNSGAANSSGTERTVIISADNVTFTNNGMMSVDGFGGGDADRATLIQSTGIGSVIDNAVGASMVSQGRNVISSYVFDNNTGASVAENVTINNDGLMESTDDTIRLGQGVINNTGTIRTTGLFDFFGNYTPGYASDAIAIISSFDASYVPPVDGLLVVNNSATGILEGARSAIQMQGGGTVNNDGTMTADVTAILVNGSQNFSSIFVLNNTGTITVGAEDYGLNQGDFRGAISVFGGLDSADITNSGTISGAYWGIYSAEGVVLDNSGLIEGDTDNTGGDDFSFYGRKLVDTEAGTSSGYASAYSGFQFVTTQNISLNANGHLVTPSGTFSFNGSFLVTYLSNLSGNPIMPLVDFAATVTAGQVVFQMDANGLVYPASVDVPTANHGVVTVTFVSGQDPVVTDASGNPVYGTNPAVDYIDTIDNSGTMDGIVSTGMGNDVITNSGTIIGEVHLGGGNDKYTATGSGTEGDIYGGAGTDTIMGSNVEDDFIYGEDGTDYLRGRGGNDTLHGGFGSDWLRGGAGADVLNGHAGSDWADYITSNAGVTVNLLTNTGTGGHAQGDTYILVERVYGSSHDDHITGDNGVNWLRGYHGDDQLFGGAGGDYLQGGTGADVLDGGTGQDWGYYVSSTSGLTVNLGNTALNTGEAIGDTYVSIENLFGSRYNDNLTGDSGNNFLRGHLGDDVMFGGDGNDFLRGDQGADTMDGGAGLDWLYYAASTAAVTIDLAAGTASGGHAAGDTFTSIERVFGSRYADNITGDSGVNYLRGYTGNDTLVGGAGTDFLQGDAGADAMDGGTGTDWAVYVSATTGVTVNLGDSSQNTGEAFGDTYTSIESLRGSNHNDILTGDAGTNYIVGGAGDDIINGGAGNDTLRGDAGNDTFVFEVGTFRDKVVNYVDADDMLDFTDFGFADVAAALATAVDTAGGDVLFTIGADQITIENTTIAEITDNILI